MLVSLYVLLFVFVYSDCIVGLWYGEMFVLGVMF